MNKTSIEYLTHTWNPIAMRCTKVSEACENCWHLRTADRLKNNPKLPMDVREALTGDREPFVVFERFGAPLRRRKRSIIGVQLMGDLFHESIKDWQLDEVFGIFLACSEFTNYDHKFLILTKRERRMLEYLSGDPSGLIRRWAEAVNAAAACDNMDERFSDYVGARTCGEIDEKGRYVGNPGKLFSYPANVFPLTNLFIGVTAENQRRADERIPILTQIPAAVRFVSFEPLLGDVNLEMLTGNYRDKPLPLRSTVDGLSWVTCGAETGPNKRPMDLDWAKSLRDQCRAAGVPFFFKKDSNGNRELDGVVWEEVPNGSHSPRL